MPCPHFDIKIVQRSNRQSAVASAAYQSGERLFSEYDQKQKYYSHKSEIVHMGPAVSQMEKWGLKTNVGNLNRDIRTGNSLMQSIRHMVHSLKGWLSGLKKKRAALLEVWEQAKEPTLPDLLSRYMDLRSRERADWTSRGKLKGTVNDFNKVREALDFLREKGISTVGSLDAYFDEVSEKVVSIRTDVRKTERRIKAIDAVLSHIGNHDAHREELDAYLAAVRYFKAHEKEQPFDRKKLDAERRTLSGELPVRNEELKAVQADVQVLRDVRNWINHVLPPEQRRATAEPGRRPSVREDLNWKAEGVNRQEEQRQKERQNLPPSTGKKLDMEH